MTELEILYAYAEHKEIQHPNHPDVTYRLNYLSQMHTPDGWVKAFVYCSICESYPVTYVRPVNEFGKFTVADKPKEADCAMY